MQYHFKTHGTCASHIDFNLDEDTISDIKFTSGCSGNLKALAVLLEGSSADMIISKCSGITCGRRKTSCADQLAKAVRDAVKMNNEK